MTFRRSLAASWPLLALLVVPLAPAGEKAPQKGQRVFTAGHSFHMMIPGPLAEIAKFAGFKGHEIAGTQSIGGSRTIQHWDRADDQNAAKKAIKAGKVDVLTLSPHVKIPDEGIDKFTELLLEHNPDARVLVQLSWYPFDMPGRNNKDFKNAERDDAKIADLRKGFDPFHKALSKQIAGLNEKLMEKHKRQVVFLVPVGQAVMALREKVVEGKAPGIEKQSQLFTDPIGHCRPPVSALNAYVHFAVLYGRSPVGLAVPSVMGKSALPQPADQQEKLNRLLQEIAWDAVKAEPLAGVK